MSRAPWRGTGDQCDTAGEQGSDGAPSRRLAGVDAAIFERDGALFVPGEIARGPWDPRAQHGGPPSALAARAIEHHEPEGAGRVARLTIELLRPVPLTPIEVRTRTLRPGKKVQLVEAALFADDVEVVRATGLRVREKAVALPADVSAAAPLPDPRSLPHARFTRMEGPSFADAMEIVPVVGTPGESGPGTAWFRLGVDVVAGEETSPLQRVAAAADFGNGISAVVDWDAGWLFINPDLTVYLHRYPVGEWVALEALTHVSGTGVGMAEAALYDETGRIGRSMQSLLLDQLP